MNHIIKLKYNNTHEVFMIEYIKEKLGLGEKDRESVSKPGQKLLWCPLFDIYKKQMKHAWKYANKYPQGLIIHWNSGHDGTGCIDYGITQGYTYHFLQKSGKFWQTHALDGGGYHAGVSKWPGLGSSVSGKLVGVEISSAGKVQVKPGEVAHPEEEKVYTVLAKAWFDSDYKPYVVRYRSKNMVTPGFYEVYTKEQEHALTEYCLWLKWNCPEVFNLDYVLGHDDVAPGRKCDPGASLSMTTSAYREYLKKEYAKRYPSLT